MTRKRGRSVTTGKSPTNNIPFDNVRGCITKNRYKNRKEVKEKQARLRKYNIFVDFYRCKGCGGWHFTRGK